MAHSVTNSMPCFDESLRDYSLHVASDGLSLCVVVLCCFCMTLFIERSLLLLVSCVCVCVCASCVVEHRGGTVRYMTTVSSLGRWRRCAVTSTFRSFSSA